MLIIRRLLSYANWVRDFRIILKTSFLYPGLVVCCTSVANPWPAILERGRRVQHMGPSYANHRSLLWQIKALFVPKNWFSSTFQTYRGVTKHPIHPPPLNQPLHMLIQTVSARCMEADGSLLCKTIIDNCVLLVN